MDAALELLQVATAFQKSKHPDWGTISWAQPLLRPAANAKQAQDFSKVQSLAGISQQACLHQAGSEETGKRDGDEGSSSSGGAEARAHGVVSVRALSLEEAAQRVPGLPSEQLGAALGPELAASAALLVDGAHVLQPTLYLRCTVCLHFTLLGATYQHPTGCFCRLDNLPSLHVCESYASSSMLLC